MSKPNSTWLKHNILTTKIQHPLYLSIYFLQPVYCLVMLRSSQFARYRVDLLKRKCSEAVAVSQYSSTAVRTCGLGKFGLGKSTLESGLPKNGGQEYSHFCFWNSSELDDVTTSAGLGCCTELYTCI